MNPIDLHMSAQAAERDAKQTRNSSAAGARSESVVREFQRRAFLRYGFGGLGMIALNSLLTPEAFGQNPSSKGVVNPLHHPAKAKRIIFLYQAGGPSHLETFDYKPRLAQLDGKPMPESLTKGQQIAQLQGKELKCFGPQHKFERFGKNGEMLCSLFPNIGGIVDDLCIVRSMTTEQINHDPAHTIMNTGSIIPGRPSMGSWLLYGLGSEAENLPGFVVLMSSGKGGNGRPDSWQAGSRESSSTPSATRFSISTIRRASVRSSNSSPSRR